MDWFSNNNIKKTESIEDNVKDFKRNSDNKIDAKQRGFDFIENSHISVNKDISGTKLGLSYNFEYLTKNHIEILKQCKLENTATELMEISKRSNKSKFKNDILNPLLKSNFLELTIPEKPKSPKQKYRLTGKFVAKIPKGWLFKVFFDNDRQILYLNNFTNELIQRAADDNNRLKNKF